jgi:hypothetical protein
MTRGWARRWLVRSALVLVAFSVLGRGWLMVASARDHFSIRGTATGLLPGAPGDLVLTIENPFGFSIVVHGIAVLPGNASRACGSNNLASPGLTRVVRVQARSNVTLTVPITLKATSPSSCAGQSFPLTFSGTATRG